MADQLYIPKKSLMGILVDKKIVNEETLQKAEEQLAQEGTKSRNQLLHILTENFGVDRDILFGEAAQYYAFRTLEIGTDSTDDGVLGFIRKELQTLPLYLREKAIEAKILPYMLDAERENRLIIITPDPTNPNIHKYAGSFNKQKYEICYVPLSRWDELWNRVSIDRAIYKDKETELRESGFVNVNI